MATEFIKNLEREGTTAQIDAANGSHARMSYKDTTLKMWSYIENDGTTKNHMVTLDDNFRVIHAGDASTGFGMNALKLFFGPADDHSIFDNSGKLQLKSDTNLQIRPDSSITEFLDGADVEKLTIDVSGTRPIFKAKDSDLFQFLGDTTPFNELNISLVGTVVHLETTASALFTIKPLPVVPPRKCTLP